MEPRFNRLLLVDDRLPHAVERLESSMDPVEGRFVLHGHVSEGGPIIDGALPATAVGGPIGEALRGFREESAATAGLYHGPLVLRLRIDPTGSVAECPALLDRVMHPDPGHADWEDVRERLLARLRSVEFPPAAGETVVTLPIAFGTPLAGAA